MVLTSRRLTLAEFLELPEEKPALEYFEGEIRRKMAAKRTHAWIQFEIAAWVNTFARSKKVALAFPEVRTTFGGASLVPDVAVYRWARIPVTPFGKIADTSPDPQLEVPDIAIEILSPKQSLRYLTRRCQQFLAHGAAAALIIDPIRETIRLYRHESPEQLLTGEMRVDLDQVLPGFELTPKALFDTLYLR